LPKLNEILQHEAVEPTNAEEALPNTSTANIQLVVSEAGELVEVESKNEDAAL
jgi:hypothetical protein